MSLSRAVVVAAAPAKLSGSEVKYLLGAIALFVVIIGLIWLTSRGKS